MAIVKRARGMEASAQKQITTDNPIGAEWINPPFTVSGFWSTPRRLPTCRAVLCSAATRHP